MQQFKSRCRLIALASLLVFVMFVVVKSNIFSSKEQVTTMYARSVECGSFNKVDFYIYSFANGLKDKAFDYLSAENIKKSIEPYLDESFKSNNIQTYSVHPELYTFHLKGYSRSQEIGVLDWNPFKDKEKLNIFIIVSQVRVSGHSAIGVSVGRYRNVNVEYTPDILFKNIDNHMSFLLDQSQEQVQQEISKFITLNFCQPVVLD